MGKPLSKELLVFLVMTILAVGYVVMDVNSVQTSNDVAGEAYQQPAKYGELHVVTGGVSAELVFTNSDGQEVTIPFAADENCVDCSNNGLNEPVYYGTDAPVSENSHIDELVYLEGEVCDGQKENANVLACTGGYFIVLDKQNNAHLLQIGNIDLSNSKVDFKDFTYGNQYNNQKFTMNKVTPFMLGNMGFRLMISKNRIKFVSTGSGKPINVLGGKTLVLGGWSVDTQLSSEIIFNAGKGEQEILLLNYDGDDKDTIIVDVEPKNTKYHTNDLGNGFIEIKTYMTSMIYDKEDLKSLVIKYKY